VEVARAKLADNLSTLKSPAAYAEFTDELKLKVRQGKDAAVRRVKIGLEEKADFYLENLKARAAANPAAVLAIAAGLAWQLFRKPPIATALVGAGVVSLLRGSPSEPRGHRETADYLSEAKIRLKEQASTLAESAKDEAFAVGHAVAEKASELATAGKEQLFEWGERASSTLQGVSSDRRELDAGLSFEHRATYPHPSPRQVVPYFHGALSEDETKDSLLLGAAGLAVAGALAIALGRATSEGENYTGS
jgi:hypothetical protein